MISFSYIFRGIPRSNLNMKLLVIISVRAAFLVLTDSAEGAKLGDIESSIELLNFLEPRQGTYLMQTFGT